MDKLSSIRPRKPFSECSPRYKACINNLVAKARNELLKSASQNVARNKLLKSASQLQSSVRCTSTLREFSQNIEPTTIREPINNISQQLAALQNYIQESTEMIVSRLEGIERTQREHSKMLKRLYTNRSTTVKDVPSVLPFGRCQDLLNFDNASKEDYEEVLAYLVYLGGFNPTDAASRYLKKKKKKKKKSRSVSSSTLFLLYLAKALPAVVFLNL